ncbi:glutamyl-tRNA reductase [Prolixibacteraceae bacterium JC049]|nr:glutamyl-tRNA reductase [Prolixibacteraceae bacterium JC049]
MIGVLGISYKTAPIDIRAQFSFTPDEVIQFGERVQQETGISEIVVLSTCNRTEIYFYIDKSCSKGIVSALTEQVHRFKKLDSRYMDAFYSYTYSKAIEHLFGVVAGIDSMVVGEDQIVNQVKEAYVHCTEAALTDAVLMRLFQKSFECGKRVRTETEIQRGASSVSYLAVDAIAQQFCNLSEKKVLLVGAGETGRLAIYNLKKRGVNDFWVANRTLERAQNVAQEFGGEAVVFDELKEYLPLADIIVVATGANKYIISQTDIEAASKLHNGADQLYVDLSVPRNIEPLASPIEKVKMVEVDSLQAIIEETKEKREESVAYARIIIDKYVDDFEKWFDSRALRPIIQDINIALKNIRKSELKEYQRSESEEVAEAVDRYTSLLTEKYIRYFIKNLKDLPLNGDSNKSLDLISEMFKADQKKNR